MKSTCSTSCGYFNVPGFGGADGAPDRLVDPIEMTDHLVDGLFAAQNALVADNDAHDITVVCPIDADQLLYFTLVGLRIRA